MPTTSVPLKPARWLEARSLDPDHPSYTGHHAWAGKLAAGYAAALVVHDAEAREEALPLHDAQQLREETVVIAAGQLSEWMLNDLEDKASYPTE